ncbi:hypothetical protein [Vibrio alginolyticus]|uniref:hypothetical protein n=2 Tax=Vibrio harveyi group TaxID=717610 RepID=UPI001172C114|nr:hypothetical protein CGH95_08850 [Vibrio parahaemolyticus]HAS6878219.1 hypothetical protein [Vibrio parahaemolyticus]HCH1454906.1 hypothetical protein [Vibrio parahaemolyticus]
MTRIVEQELTKVEERLYFFSDDEDSDIEKEPHMAFSQCFTESGMFCGQIVYVEPGNSVPVISRNDYAKSTLSVEALHFNDESSREYLDSIAFVSVVNNHVIILQSKAIRIKDVEEYINHLLRTCGEFDDAEFVVLQANNLTLDDNTLRNKQVKNVNLSLPLSANWASPEEDPAFEILRTLIGHQRIEEIKNRQTTDSSDLKIDINIGYKYNTTDTNQKILTQITQDLLDNRDESLVIELKGAGRLIGDEIQLKVAINLPYDNSLPVTEHVFQQMMDWLLELLDQGVINP